MSQKNQNNNKVSDKIVFVAPNIYVLRNWIATGLVDKCQQQLNLIPVFISHFTDKNYKSLDGKELDNYCLPVSKHKEYELPTGFSKILYFIYFLRVRTFALELENGSWQMMMFSRRRDFAHCICKVIKYLFPRGSVQRSFIRSLVDSINPYHKDCAQLLKRIQPKCIVVGSPGFLFFDQLLIIEAKRQNIPVHCVVNSWDNMTSRGPMIRRTDTLMVWNGYMKEQASKIHQYPISKVYVVGPLQFCQYDIDETEEEKKAIYQRLGIPYGTPYLLYLTGQHVSEYEAEDVEVLLQKLETTRFANMSLVVRIHSQANNEPFKLIKHNKLVLDCPPKFSSKGNNGLCFDLKEMRMMASLLKNSQIVFSSWGTTALLEAAIFDRPIIQLRWMNAFQRKYPEQAGKVIDFQKYLHLIPFDESKCRIFSDIPEKLGQDIDALIDNNREFFLNRKTAVIRLTVPPLNDAPQRVINVLKKNLE